MRYKNIFKIIKLLIQLTLFVVFLNFFGLDAFNRYQEKRTMIVKSKRETGGIEGLTMTVVAKNNQTKTGWNQESEVFSEESDDLTSILCNDHEKFETIQNCIQNKTFDRETTVKDIHVGINEFKVSILNESLWTEDFTVGFEGRYFAVTIPRKITTEWRQDQIFLYMNPNLIYDIYLHESSYFILNKHSYGLPTCHLEITPDPLRGRYYELILTEHEVLNLPKDPCEPNKNYNFQVKVKVLEDICLVTPLQGCIKAHFSSLVDCRLPWDKLSQKVVCTGIEDFRSVLLNLYQSLELKVNLTGI